LPDITAIICGVRGVGAGRDDRVRGVGASRDDREVDVV